MPVPARLLLCVTLLLGQVSTASAQSEAPETGGPPTEVGDTEPATIEAERDIIDELDPAPERVGGLDGFRAPTPAPPAPIESTETWALGGGSGDAIAWQPVSPPLLPTGPAIAGLQLRVGAALLGENSANDSFAIELGGVFDVRYGGGPFHLRLAFAFEYVQATPVALAAGIVSQPSPFAIKGRVLPLALDLGPAFALRFGADLGVWLSQTGEVTALDFLYAPLTEGAVRIRQLDGLLEFGFYLGFHARATYIVGSFGTSRSFGAQAIGGVQSMWTFQ